MIQGLEALKLFSSRGGGEAGKIFSLIPKIIMGIMQRESITAGGLKIPGKDGIAAYIDFIKKGKELICPTIRFSVNYSDVVADAAREIVIAENLNKLDIDKHFNNGNPGLSNIYSHLFRMVLGTQLADPNFSGEISEDLLLLVVGSATGRLMSGDYDCQDFAENLVLVQELMKNDRLSIDSKEYLFYPAK